MDALCEIPQMAMLAFAKTAFLIRVGIDFSIEKS
jgi:hypothetical protein